jgi:predicted outer membrane lipoprotein
MRDALWLEHTLKHKYKFPLYLSFSLIVFLHLIDSSSFEFFEFFGDLTADDDMMLSSEIFGELLECAFDTMN